MLRRLSGIIKNLGVHPERMLENLNKLKGLIFSQRVLIRLTDLGLKRDTAYEMVQRNALKVWDTGKDFKTLLLEDEELMEHVSAQEVEDVFDLDYHLKHVDEIFRRVFG